LNWSENFRRFVISVFLLHVGIHLNRLSDFAGPLHKQVRELDEDDWHIINKPAKGIVVTLGDLMILAEEVRQFEVECDLLRRPAAHIGSTPNYDWDGMYLTLIRRVHEQGVPPTQAEWVGEVQEWFVGHSETGKVPDERTIRRRITPIWKALRGPCC
jgi:hypothetical protein